MPARPGPVRRQCLSRRRPATRLPVAPAPQRPRCPPPPEAYWLRGGRPPAYRRRRRRRRDGRAFPPHRHGDDVIRSVTSAAAGPVGCCRQHRLGACATVPGPRGRILKANQRSRKWWPLYKVVALFATGNAYRYRLLCPSTRHVSPTHRLAAAAAAPPCRRRAVASGRLRGLLHGGRQRRRYALLLLLLLAAGRGAAGGTPALRLLRPAGAAIRGALLPELEWRRTRT